MNIDEVLMDTITFKLLCRTKNDGYLYIGSDNQIYFCDHSGDDRWNCPHGPDACHDTPSPLDLKTVDCAPVTRHDARVIHRQDGRTVLLSENIYERLQGIIKAMKILRIN